MAVGCGDKKPEGTTPPGESGGSEAGGSGGGGGGGGGGDESGGGGDEGGGDAGGGGGEVAQECPAEVSETPTALFADKLVMRLPKHVELVERNPFLFTANNVESTCEAIVTRMAVGYFEYDPNKPVKEVRDGVMGQLGYQAGDVLGWSEESEKGPNYTGIFEVGEGPKGEPPVKGLVALKEAEGIHYWAIYEAHPNAWPAIKATYAESAKRMLILRSKK
ncbi:MAG: hypothetical protein H6711_27300 [Myxococcales bacterium]|nr:hypothetical protein [Myxococcales bacterium]